MENMGIIALGFGIGGIAVIGSLLQIFFHALNKGLLFLSSGNVLAATHERRIDKIRNLSKNFPITGIVLLFGAMGISGMPPFAMFLGEIYIMTGVFRNDIWLGFLVFILLILVFIGLFGKVLKMYVGKANASDEEEDGELKTGSTGASHKTVIEAGLHPFIVYVPLIMLLFSSFLLFYIPYPFLHIIKSAAAEFGGRLIFK
jgi:hydrogenase-4 component F